MTQHTITLTDQDLLVLNEALINLPFKVVAPLIERIGKQLQESNNDKNTQLIQPITNDILPH